MACLSTCIASPNYIEALACLMQHITFCTDAVEIIRALNFMSWSSRPDVQDCQGFCGRKRGVFGLTEPIAVVFIVLVISATILQDQAFLQDLTVCRALKLMAFESSVWGRNGRTHLYEVAKSLIGMHVRLG